MEVCGLEEDWVILAAGLAAERNQSFKVLGQLFGNTESNIPSSAKTRVYGSNHNNDATIRVKEEGSITTTRPGSVIDALIFDDTGLASELDTDVMAPILAPQYRRTSYYSAVSTH